MVPRSPVHTSKFASIFRPFKAHEKAHTRNTSTASVWSKKRVRRSYIPTSHRIIMLGGVIKHHLAPLTPRQRACPPALPTQTHLKMQMQASSTFKGVRVQPKVHLCWCGLAQQNVVPQHRWQCISTARAHSEQQTTQRTRPWRGRGTASPARAKLRGQWSADTAPDSPHSPLLHTTCPPPAHAPPGREACRRGARRQAGGQLQRGAQENPDDGCVWQRVRLS